MKFSNQQNFCMNNNACLTALHYNLDYEEIPENFTDLPWIFIICFVASSRKGLETIAKKYCLILTLRVADTPFLGIKKIQVNSKIWQIIKLYEIKVLYNSSQKCILFKIQDFKKCVILASKKKRVFQDRSFVFYLKTTEVYRKITIKKMKVINRQTNWTQVHDSKPNGL